LVLKTLYLFVLPPISNIRNKTKKLMVLNVICFIFPCLTFFKDERVLLQNNGKIEKMFDLLIKIFNGWETCANPS